MVRSPAGAKQACAGAGAACGERRVRGGQWEPPAPRGCVPGCSSSAGAQAWGTLLWPPGPLRPLRPHPALALLLAAPQKNHCVRAVSDPGSLPPHPPGPAGQGSIISFVWSP